MSFEEKNAWAFLFVSIAAYAVYLAIILSRAAGGPLVEVDYAPTLLWTVGAGIAGGILANILIAISAPKDADKRDQRDREIRQFGDRIGQSFVIVGGVAALLLALVRADYFWIANVLYLAFVLSAVLGSIAKLVSYRRGLKQW